ncbi:MAG TPA: OB-fold nucleic acid binding domain-containing protein, partial [Pedobacter sp.]|uniref:OB-fold nucleic acid binding domain-containing protein n=1 Tax=Pedobacter sp. TaxID=1411316 RepID=UPI002CD8057C
LEKLADADAFRSMGLDRRQALWEVSALADTPVVLFEGQPSESVTEAQVALPFMSAGEQVLQDYAATSLSLKAHPVSFVREKLKLLHVLTANELKEKKDGDLVKVAGLVLVRQRPGTASGICFMTIEDETGNANLVVFQKLFDQFRKTILQSKLIMVEGRLQKEGEVIHVILMRCHNYNKLLGNLTAVQDEEQENVFHKGRNFK